MQRRLTVIGRQPFHLPPRYRLQSRRAQRVARQFQQLLGTRHDRGDPLKLFFEGQAIQLSAPPLEELFLELSDEPVLLDLLL
jgi:hypothetical protein